MRCFIVLPLRPKGLYQGFTSPLVLMARDFLWVFEWSLI